MDHITSHRRARVERLRILLVGLAAASLVTGCGVAATPSLTAGPRSAPLPSASTTAPSPSANLSVEPSASYPPGVIFEGSLRVDAAWSPKGTRIAVVAGASGEVPTVSIIDPKGRVQDHFEAADFAWLDDDTYIAINGTSGLSGDGGFTTFTGVVGSSARQTIPGSYWQIVAGPAGAVALKLNETGGDQYVIWGQSSVSSPRDGVPVAFSPDGSLLAVVHYPRACCAGSPSPEPTEAPGPTTLDIVRTDTGESVRVTGDVNWGYGLPVDFSPDGRTVAYRIDRATGPEEVGILDIATGEVWTLPGQPDVVADSAIAWIDSSHLAVRSVFATHTAPAGLKIAVSYLPTDVAAMAVSSRGDVATARNGSPQIVIDRGGQQRTLDLPGTFDAVGLKWSPDGSTLMVACTSFVRGTPGRVVVLSP